MEEGRSGSRNEKTAPAKVGEGRTGLTILLQRKLGREELD
jgi:uncharacterized low-complexity protein